MRANCIGSNVLLKLMFIHEYKVYKLLFKHMHLTFSCHLWFELFRISIALDIRRTQCFSSQDRGQGHKRSCSHCINHIVCVILFSASSTPLRSPVCRLRVGLIHQREKTHQAFSVSGVCVCVSSLSNVQGGGTACTNVCVFFPCS